MKTQYRSDRDRSSQLLNDGSYQQDDNQVQPIGTLINHSFDSANLLLFEAQLARSGLLVRLEGSGVIPKLRNPNPFDPMNNTAGHDNWWKSNPEKQNDYLKRVAEREKALRQLYVGMQLR